MRHWLIKSEPSEYSYEQLERDRKTQWSGIRNFQARNNIRQMEVGDLALYYHTGDERRIVGIARVASKPTPDRTAEQGEEWFAIDVEPAARLNEPVTLLAIKAQKVLAGFAVVKQGRLSVAPVTPAQFTAILKLGKTRL